MDDFALGMQIALEQLLQPPISYFTALAIIVVLILVGRSVPTYGMKAAGIIMVVAGVLWLVIGVSFDQSSKYWKSAMPTYLIGGATLVVGVVVTVWGSKYDARRKAAEQAALDSIPHPMD